MQFAECCLKEIEGIPSDHAQAIHWLHEVLSNPQRTWSEEDRANTILGVAHLTGLAGVEQDFNKAFQLLSLVASREEGLAFEAYVAFQFLGYMHEEGLGITKDIDAANLCYAKVEGESRVEFWGERTFGANSFWWSAFDHARPLKPGKLQLRLSGKVALSASMWERWRKTKSAEASKE